MTAALYIIKDRDAYRFGLDPIVQLWEPESISRIWIRRVVVELPEGFHVAESASCNLCLYCGDKDYGLATNKAGDPVVVDHNNNGSFIPLSIVSEGWDEA